MSSINNMNNRLIGMMVALAFAGMVTPACGGNLDALAAPTNLASAMWTLNDIYNVLDTRTTNVTKRAGATAFAEPTDGPTNGTMHTLNDIMTLVSNRAPVRKTGATNTYAVGDDGTNRIGVTWPNPRFTAVGSGADTNQIRDNLTGLIWARDASNACNLAAAKTNWATAVASCATLSYGGANDWRMPNMLELQSLFVWQYFYPILCNTAGTGPWTENDPFTGVQSDKYWSSTSLDAWYAFFCDLSDGHEGHGDKTLNFYVWPVRGGQ